jgi:hypothetical protein
MGKCVSAGFIAGRARKLVTDVSTTTSSPPPRHSSPRPPFMPPFRHIPPLLNPPQFRRLAPVRAWFVYVALLQFLFFVAVRTAVVASRPLPSFFLDNATFSTATVICSVRSCCFDNDAIDRATGTPGCSGDDVDAVIARFEASPAVVAANVTFNCAADLARIRRLTDLPPPSNGSLLLRDVLRESCGATGLVLDTAFFLRRISARLNESCSDIDGPPPSNLDETVQLFARAFSDRSCPAISDFRDIIPMFVEGRARFSIFFILYILSLCLGILVFAANAVLFDSHWDLFGALGLEAFLLVNVGVNFVQAFSRAVSDAPLTNELPLTYISLRSLVPIIVAQLVGASLFAVAFVAIAVFIFRAMERNSFTTFYFAGGGKTRLRGRGGGGGVRVL